MPASRLPAGLRFLLLLVVAPVVGLVAGSMEGAVYPASGPRIPLLSYWSLLATLLLLSLFALAQAVDGRRGRALAHAFALLPLCVVVQDAASLVLQGSHWSTATWYSEVLGPNVLTLNNGVIPGFYWVFTLVTVLLLALTVWGPALVRRAGGDAPRRAGGA